MQRGVMPNQRCVSETRREGLEEERRLAYVAVTRAKLQLFITENEGQFYGGGNRVPSRFIFEIDSKRIQRNGYVPEYLAEMTRKIIQNEGLEFDSNGDYDVLTIGTRVKHPAFGDGTIEKVESSRNEYLIRMDRTDSLMHIRMDYKGLTVITDAPKDDNTTDCLPADEPESQPTEEVVEPTAPALMWKAGDEVIHPLFGLGKIMEVNPDSREYSIYVNQGGFTISVDFNFDGLRAKS